MDKNKLKVLVEKLKKLVSELESEIYSDVSAYTNNQSIPIMDYDEVFYGDDDGYPD